MSFILVRLLPIVIPLVYAAIIGLVLGPIFWWPVWLAVILGLIILWCGLVSWRRQRWDSWWFGLYAALMVGIGFGYILLIGSPTAIVAITLGWTWLLMLYFEGAFNYLYQTEKVFVVDLKHVVGYFNLIAFFLATAALANAYIFLQLSWWIVVPGVFVGAGIMIVTRLISHGHTWSAALRYGSIIALVMTEITVVVIWWPVSFYVMAAIAGALYYWLASLAVAALDRVLTRQVIVQYSAVTLAVIVVALATAQWL